MREQIELRSIRNSVQSLPSANLTKRITITIMATNTVITNIAPTRVQTTAPKLTAADKSRLADALAELNRLDARLDEVNNLRDFVNAAAVAFGRGELTISQAAGLATIDPARLPDARGVLRAGCKSVAKGVVEAVADLVEGHREHVVDDLLGRCKQMETAERDNARNVGIGDDDFRPSGLLESLREQHRRAHGLIGTLITRSDLNQLAKAAGIAIPTGEAEAEDADEDD
jgi:hypothetical protein